MTPAERVMVFRVPDWPVRAHLLERRGEHGTGSEARSGAGAEDGTAAPPLALVAQHRVAACDAAARAEGVRIGQRMREAQSRCPTLVAHPYDPEVDARRFAPVLAALERLIPGVEPLRPGRCAMRARGPARYYGDESRAAEAILGLAADLGLHGARVGIADGRFAAEQAARAGIGDPGVAAPTPGVRAVPPGGSAAFLAPLPVDRAAGDELAEVLHGLGIRTLGALAALPEDAVGQRFGAEGLAARRRASGEPPGPGTEIRPRAPERELAAELAFEPPLDSSEQLAFACTALAERFIGGLAEARLVGTALRIELTDDLGVRHERLWIHPGRFTAADAVNRIRWQADAMPRDPERGGAGIVAVRIAPAHTDRAAAHEPGLWNAGIDERVHHHLSRAQSRLGHTGVGTVQLTGGRLTAERQRFVPWGTRQRSSDAARGPWPGALPGPHPSTVFPAPIPAELTDPDENPLGIDGDDMLDGRPARLCVDAGQPARVTGWSLPWPLRERWWEGRPARFRLQVQLEGGAAWLLLHEGGRWLAEGSYD